MLSRFSHYFAEVAKRGSIRQASDYLNISPSAIDRQILKMEAALGIALFERTSQGLRLTAGGEFALETVQRLQREQAQFHFRIDELRGIRRGEITIAMVEGVTEFVTQQLAGFRDQYPAITYALQVAPSLRVSALVRAGHAEIGIGFPGDHADVRVEDVMLFQFGLVVPPTHRWAETGEMRIVDCIDEPLILPDETMSLRRIVEQSWEASAGVKPKRVATVNSIAALKTMVLHGLGIGVTSPLEIASELETGQLKFVPLVGRNMPMANYSVFTMAGRRLTAPASLLVHHLGTGMAMRMAQQAASQSNG